MDWEGSVKKPSWPGEAKKGWSLALRGGRAESLKVPEERMTYSVTVLALPELLLPPEAEGSLRKTWSPPRGTKMMGLPQRSRRRGGSMGNGLGLGVPGVRVGGVSRMRLGGTPETMVRFLGSLRRRYMTAWVRRTALADQRGLERPDL